MTPIEQQIKQYLEERNWNNLRPGDIAKSIMIEGAELLEHFQWSNPAGEEIKKDEVKLKAISKELADVFIYSLELSILLGLDTERIILDKLEKAKIKYPVDKVKVVGGVDVPTSSEYFKIKEQYRKEGKN